MEAMKAACEFIAGELDKYRRSLEDVAASISKAVQQGRWDTSREQQKHVPLAALPLS